jgi:hypothetical protein
VKPRSSQAAQLEQDYLRRVDAALASRPPDERAETLQNLRAHIDEAIGAGDAPATLTEMAQVIERLGAPESFSSATPPAVLPYAQPASVPRQEAATLLGRVWLGELIQISGLWVPVISFYFCQVVGAIIVGRALTGPGASFSPTLRTVGRLSYGVAAASLGITATLIAAVAVRELAMLSLPLLLVEFVCGIVGSWLFMTMLAEWMQGIGRDDLYRLVRIRRNVSIFVVGPLLLLTGMILAAALRDTLAAGIALLPFHWLLGWYLILRPITLSRRALQAEAVVPGGPAWAAMS